jgi:hypothetical protein
MAMALPVGQICADGAPNGNGNRLDDELGTAFAAEPQRHSIGRPTKTRPQLGHLCAD